jgi:chemotaxis receptor (MCP) glutamine deamidase CheD
MADCPWLGPAGRNNAAVCAAKRYINDGNINAFAATIGENQGRKVPIAKLMPAL